MFKRKYNLSQVQCKLLDDGRRPKHVGAIFIRILIKILMCFKLIKVDLLVSELYIYQNARWNNKKIKDKRNVIQLNYYLQTSFL